MNLLKSVVLWQTVSKSKELPELHIWLWFIWILYGKNFMCSFALFIFSQMNKKLLYGGLWPTKDGKHVSIQLLALVLNGVVVKKTTNTE